MDSRLADVVATTTVLLLLLSRVTTITIHSGSIAPYFTASHYIYIENSGGFLRSTNSNYTAAIVNPQPASPYFYLVVYHSASHTVVWTANRNTPVSSSGQFRLSVTGITINNDSGASIWSTPAIGSTVASLQLLNSGNLILQDRFNTTLWQSFDFPTDTVVSGQKFPMGRSLIARSSPSDFYDGDYSFTLTSTDAILQWQRLTYYKLSMDSRYIENSARPVSYLIVNGSGFNLIGESGSDIATTVLMQSPVSDSDYRILKILNDGHLVVLRYTDNNWVTDFTSPVDRCRTPFRCGRLGLCFSGGCSCPPGFHSDLETNFGCSLSDNSLSLPDDKLMFIKAMHSSSSTNQNSTLISDFPLIGKVLLPASGVLLISIVAIWMCLSSRKNKKMKFNSKKLVDNSYTDDIELFLIAGLPVRFRYEDLVQATTNFSTPIGSGGFGTVFKGVLCDKTVVAVKKITTLGSQGNKEFGTEIMIIGNIHHVNLVKLKGFCTQGRIQ